MQVLKLGQWVLPAVAAMILAVALLAMPATAQQASGSDPVAQSATEQQLFDELNKITGRVTIPNPQAATLEQPQGRAFQAFHETTLPWIAGIVILGMVAVLVVFYLVRGRIRTRGPKANVRIVRFNAVERFGHWLTATAFIVLAITGLNFIFGKRLLMPLIGADAFGSWSQVAMYAHDYFAWAFIAGVLLLFVMWVWDNLPDRYDVNWLKQGGGLFDKSGNTHPPAGRFNAGQKLVFWSVVLGGGALAASGVFLLFPFVFTDVNGMQTAQVVHAIVAALLVAVIIAHIYIGSFGMEGAFEAMGTGTVDLNWARAHHSAWVEKKGDAGAPPERAATPAE